MLNVATAVVNWNSVDLPEHEQDYGYPRILDLVQQAGYAAMEYSPSFGTDPGTLMEDANQHGLTWCGSYHAADLTAGPLSGDHLRDVEALVSLLVSIGCHDLVAADKGAPERVALAGQIPEDGSASLSTDAYPLVAANLHAIAAIAQRHEVKVHFHNHVGTWIETPAELDALMEHLDLSLVDLCFDTGHYAYGGGNPLAFLREHLNQIGYIHLKDVDGDVLVEAKENGWSFHDALRRVIFSPLGEGSAQIPAILRTLTENDFGGWVVVEQDTCNGDPTDTARQNREYIGKQVGGA